MFSEQVLFYHGESTDGHRFTIAGRFQTLMRNDPDPDGADVIMLGISLCGDRDQFAKKIGRVRAEGRMKSKGNHGRNYYPLYSETLPVRWFEGQEQRVFLEAAQLNGALSRASLMRKFNL